LKPETSEPKQPHPWLIKHYEEKRLRTIRLVKAAVDRLLSEKQTVTIEAICRKSAELDSEGRGVKKSSILENPVAHAYYREHSASYRIAQGRKGRTRRKGQPAEVPAPPKQLRVDPKRDVERVRYRYLQLTKHEIVERLLMVEQFYAENQEQLARLQFEMAEMQLYQREATRRPGTSVKPE
jgi:hypothetical protein